MSLAYTQLVSQAEALIYVASSRRDVLKPLRRGEVHFWALQTTLVSQRDSHSAFPGLRAQMFV